MFRLAREIGIIPFSSVFGKDSLAALEAVDCPAYKIAKPERHIAALGRILPIGKLVFVSLAYPHEGVSGYSTPVTRIYCPGGYPANVDLATIPVMRPDGGDILPVFGVSLHDLNPGLAPLVVQRGAKYLEYHLKLDGTTPLDDAFSHTPESFKAMVKSVRATEALLG